jgi:hypothetical protein
MTNISRLVCIIAVLAGGITSPALAESAKATVSQHKRINATIPQRGISSFATVPQGAYSPALTGGGSSGYNESLIKDE